MTDADWRRAAQTDLDTLSQVWIDRYRWAPRVVDGEQRIDVYFNLHTPDRPYLLRLRYESDFQRVGRREEFCDPDDPDRFGPECWPPEGGAFKRRQGAICIPGTFGYHRKLHANDNKHPMETTTLGQLTQRIQRALVDAA